MNPGLLSFYSVCANLLGMKDGTIQDSQITASSEMNEKHPAVNARLDRPRIGGKAAAWLPATDDLTQWIQVEFAAYTYVSGIILQGRADAQAEWVTRYKIEYSNDGVIWLYVKDDNYDDIVSSESSNLL